MATKIVFPSRFSVPLQNPYPFICNMFLHLVLLCLLLVSQLGCVGHNSLFGCVKSVSSFGFIEFAGCMLANWKKNNTFS